MGQLLLINHPKFGEIRNVMVKGEPWFVAKDVCRLLGIENNRNISSRIDDDDKGESIIATPSGDQSMTVVNESGLYSLIMQSRKPEAKVFKKWVTSEVLPSIRKYGYYVAPDKTSARERALIAREYHKTLGQYITAEDKFKIAKKVRKSEFYVSAVMTGVKKDNEVMRLLQERAIENKNAWFDAYTPEKMDEVIDLLR